MVPNYNATNRVQTGVRLDRRLVKVLKGIAAEKEIGLGELIEAIVLNAFEGKKPFSPETRKQIAGFKLLYGMNLTAADAAPLREDKPE